MHLVALAAAATIVTILATIAADRAVGVLTSEQPGRTGLIFPPHSKASYHSVEFDFTATINALGFRDREFHAGRSAGCRVIVIGDSFTYGWGVSLDESWPKVLEVHMRDVGLRVEVANLGFPGGEPVGYANVAEKAIPLLEPDLVIVAVLQGDDLAQLRDSGVYAGAGGGPWTVRKTVGKVVRMLYPHLLTLVGRTEASLNRRENELSANATWKEQAERSLAQLGPNEKRRYGSLDGTIRRAFEAGELNPALVMLGVHHPEYYLRTFDLDIRDVGTMIERMSKEFTRIRRAGERRSARVIIVSVPFGLYVNPYMFNTWKERYGFILDRRMLTSDSADQAIQRAAERVGLQFFAVTQGFRRHKDAQFYFELDGHFTPRGHRFYAKELTPIVARELHDLSARCRM